MGVVMGSTCAKESDRRAVECGGDIHDMNAFYQNITRHLDKFFFCAKSAD